MEKNGEGMGQKKIDLIVIRKDRFCLFLQILQLSGCFFQEKINTYWNVEPSDDFDNNRRK